MNFLSDIKRKTIIVCNYNYQKSILDFLSKDSNMYNIKFFNMHDFLSHYYFSYDELSINYLMEKYGYSLEMSLIYLNNLMYVNNDSNINKLHFLYDLKCDLINNNLLYFDNDFKSYLKDFDVFFVGIPYFRKIEEDMITNLRNITNVSIFNSSYSYEFSLYKANSIADEVDFVASSIASLIDKGVSINNIKLANLDGDYTSFITRIFSLYNIPVNIEKHYLYGLSLAKDFLSMYDTNEIDEVINILNNKYSNKDIIKKIVNIVNKYVLISDKSIKKEFIIHDFKNTNIACRYSDAVNVIDYLNDYISDDDYVFLLNFNQNAIPSFRKDEEFITDSISDNLLLDKTVSLNKKIKDATIRRLRSIKNLVCSYKMQSPYHSFYPSNLINELNLSVFDIPRGNISYSKKWSEIRLSSMLNNFITYGSIDDDLNTYYNSFPINYLTYDNKYKLIDNNIFNRYFKDVVLSYTSMNDYYLCKFKYYVSNILKLDIFEDSFAIYIGKLFHFVLQYHFKDNKDVDDLVNLYIKDNPLKDSKEEFFINHLKNDLYFVVNTIHEQMKESNLDKALYEERIVKSLDGDVSITFKGFIDKLLYEEKDGRMIVAIIDYKTGNTDIDMSLMPYGIGMQLPVYLYLAKNSSKLNNISFAGFYLQKIIHEIPVIDTKNDINSLKVKNLKLSGYSNSDLDILHEFDHSYKDSRVISSMKVKNDGNFYSYSKVLNDDDFDLIVNKVEEKIKEAGNSISSKSFDINPKILNDVNISCNYCKFKDICYMSHDDEVIIESDKDLSFLGGDIDA